MLIQLAHTTFSYFPRGKSSITLSLDLPSKLTLYGKSVRSTELTHTTEPTTFAYYIQHLFILESHSIGGLLVHIGLTSPGSAESPTKLSFKINTNNNNTRLSVYIYIFNYKQRKRKSTTPKICTPNLIGTLIYLWNWKLKAELRSIIVMQDRPKSIFLQCLA